MRRNFPRSTELRREKSYHKESRKKLFSSEVFRVGISLFQQYRQNLKEYKSKAMRWIPLDLPKGWFASKRSLWDVWWTVPRNTEVECGKLCDPDAYKEVAASNSFKWSKKGTRGALTLFSLELTVETGCCFNFLIFGRSPFAWWNERYSTTVFRGTVSYVVQDGSRLCRLCRWNLKCDH